MLSRLSFTLSKVVRSNKEIGTCFSRRRFSTLTSTKTVVTKIQDWKIRNVFVEDYIFKDLDKWADKTALICAETGRQYTFYQLYKKSSALGAALIHGFHLNPGETVAVIMPNVPEYAIVLLGSIQAGLKITTLNPLYAQDEVRKQLLDSGPKLIFTLSSLYSYVNKVVSTLEENVKIIVIDHEMHNRSTPENAINFDQFISNNFDQDILKTIASTSRTTDDVILLPYSSGTTGIPKGVQLTNKSVVANLHQIGMPPFGLVKKSEGNFQEVVPLFLPIFHIYGMIVVLFNLLAHGCKLVTMPKFGSEIFVKCLNEHLPTVLMLAPPVANLIINHDQIKTEHLRRLNVILSAAAPFGHADVERLSEKSQYKPHILQAYGMTEMSPVTHLQTPYLENGIKSGGCGLCVPDTECKVVSSEDDKTVLGPNKTGQVFIRGPQAMKGYYNRPKETEASFDEEGFLKSGDIGYYDEHGHFFITDRLKELIKVKGFQVAPAELEELLRTHPDVEDVAVIGVPHKNFGEVPRAFVVAKRNCKIDKSDVEAYVAAKAASFKRLLGGVVVMDSIPKNPSGKILRRLLRDV